MADNNYYGASGGNFIQPQLPIPGLNSNVTTTASGAIKTTINGKTIISNPNFTSIPGTTLAHSDSCKIFVGGLSWQTNEESLRWHFEQYGPVLSVEVMRDRNTGDPRGFAFVVFESTETVDLVMVDKDKHEINHKLVDVKRAQARGVAPPSIHEKQAAAAAAAAATAASGVPSGVGARNNNNTDASSVTSSNPATTGNMNHSNSIKSSPDTAQLTPEQLHCKIFVGGLPPHVDRDELYSIFTHYGTVIDAIVMLDAHNNNKSRCFGFVTFDPDQNGAQSAAQAISEQPIQIHGRNVEIKLATPRAPTNDPNNNSGGAAGGMHHNNMRQYNPQQPFRSSTTFNNYNKNNLSSIIPPVAKNVGLRAGLTSSTMSDATNHNSEYSGLAVAFGRNGWKAGYGSLAFNNSTGYGWNVWSPEPTTPQPIKLGFSFDLLKDVRPQTITTTTTAAANEMDIDERSSKRTRH